MRQCDYFSIHILVYSSHCLQVANKWWVDLLRLLLTPPNDARAAMLLDFSPRPLYSFLFTFFGSFAVSLLQSFTLLE